MCIGRDNIARSLVQGVSTANVTIAKQVPTALTTTMSDGNTGKLMQRELDCAVLVRKYVNYDNETSETRSP